MRVIHSLESFEAYALIADNYLMALNLWSCGPETAGRDAMMWYLNLPLSEVSSMVHWVMSTGWGGGGVQESHCCIHH